MKDKYYVPDIEEFHVGFEYEYANISSYDNFKSITKETNWIKHILEEGDNCYTSEHGDYEAWSPELMGVRCMRVKYLDKEDIEELGWSDRFTSGRSFILKEDDCDYLLHIIPYTQEESDLGIRIQISELTPGKNSKDAFVIFSGWLKNTSELKKLMVQLGIK